MPYRKFLPIISIIVISFFLAWMGYWVNNILLTTQANRKNLDTVLELVASNKLLIETIARRETTPPWFFERLKRIEDNYDRIIQLLEDIHHDMREAYGIVEDGALPNDPGFRPNIPTERP